MKRTLDLLSLTLLTLLIISPLHATDLTTDEELPTPLTYINFSKDISDIIIHHDPLVLKPVRKENLDVLMPIYENKAVMQWVGDGKTKTRQTVEKELSAYEHCWRESLAKNTLFYNMRFVVSINEEVVGVVGLFTPHTNWDINKEGILGLVGFGKPEYSGKKYATIITEIMIKDYIPFLQKENFAIGEQPIKALHATAMLNNQPVNKLLKKYFNEPQYLAETEFGNPRNLYTLSLSQ
ncbi:hypothetical protein Cva_00461 [Caedimonas varicaedens]|jgi:hypothetical protein|uniref:N-acetyltransferase domain-containing protein n=1 Tax=Caedimonas varicaedens TaxID=1629334 RepID=A0A0K8MBC6_9PROT|nr:hypothetical protein Cva_00461 [Caedimonas varicaedens]